jgi:hypothetical protein
MEKETQGDLKMMPLDLILDLALALDPVLVLDPALIPARARARFPMRRTFPPG